jgi:hypothetical protein
MNRLLAVAFVSVVAVGLGTRPASAWPGCHHKYCACAAQYNAFSPFCLSTVESCHHGHHCCHVADTPCCNAPPAPACDFNGCGPACSADCDSGALGALPATAAPPAGATTGTPGAPTFKAPPPVPQVPGVTSQLGPVQMPAGMVQPVFYAPAYSNYQPAMPVNMPAYWYNGN